MQFMSKEKHFNQSLPNFRRPFLIFRTSLLNSAFALALAAACSAPAAETGQNLGQRTPASENNRVLSLGVNCVNGHIDLSLAYRDSNSDTESVSIGIKDEPEGDIYKIGSAGRNDQGLIYVGFPSVRDGVSEYANGVKQRGIKFRNGQEITVVVYNDLPSKSDEESIASSAQGGFSESSYSINAPESGSTTNPTVVPTPANRAPTPQPSYDQGYDEDQMTKYKPNEKDIIIEQSITPNCKE
jgi:hypothetical protein